LFRLFRLYYRLWALVEFLASVLGWLVFFRLGFCLVFRLGYRFFSLACFLVRVLGLLVGLGFGLGR